MSESSGPGDAGGTPAGSEGAVHRERVRVRRRRRRRRERRWAWLWAPVVAGVVLLGALVAGLFVRDALVVRDSLRAARASLDEVMVAADEIDVDEAAAALERADAELARARTRSGGPLWSLGERLPVVGSDVEVVRATVELATAAVTVGEAALEDGGPLVAEGIGVAVDEGRLDLTPLREARELLASLPAGRLAEARERLADARPSALAPDEVVTGREDSLALADRALATVEDGRTLLEALPAFLGAEEPRRYFLGVQSPAELRGTGGLIGYWAVLTVDDGDFELTESQTHETLEDGEPTTGRIGELAGDPFDGVAVAADFGERYEHVAASGHFSNVNVDPDLPTTARVALDLFEQRAGERLDGVVLLDAVGMQTILEAVGAEVALPDDLPAGVDLPAEIPAGDFAEFVTVDVYEHLGAGQGPARKRLLRALGDAAFARVFDGRWDGPTVSRAVARATEARHLQVFSTREEEQAAFAELGAAGALEAREGADLLAVTANNAVGGKQDVHLGHEVAARLTLSDPSRDAQGRVGLRRRAEVRVGVDNPLPEAGMDTYILGNCLPSGTDSGCFEGPSGQNRTWFTVWSPGESRLQPATDEGVRAGAIRGLRAFDRFLETSPGGEAAFEVVHAGRAPARVVDGALVYELTWWEQAKAVPTRLDVTVEAPAGWRVAGVEVAGGGDGRGFGPHGDGEPLEARVTDEGRGRLTGTVTADAHLRVRLVGE